MKLFIILRIIPPNVLLKQKIKKTRKENAEKEEKLQNARSEAEEKNEEFD